MPPTGLEPVAYRLGICRSIHLSYEGAAGESGETWKNSGGRRRGQPKARKLVGSRAAEQKPGNQSRERVARAFGQQGVGPPLTDGVRDALELGSHLLGRELYAR